MRQAAHQRELLQVAHGVTLTAALLTQLLTGLLAGRYVPLDGWKALLDLLPPKALNFLMIAKCLGNPLKCA